MGGYSGNSTTIVCDLLTSQNDMITHIVGDISPKTSDIIEEEIGGILVSFTSTHYDEGEKNVHLAVILVETRIRNIINDTNFVYDTPVNQGLYDPAVISNVATAANQAQMEA